MELLVLLVVAAFVGPVVVFLAIGLIVGHVGASLVVVFFSILTFPALVDLRKFVVFAVFADVLVLILSLLSVLGLVVVLLAVMVALRTSVVPLLLILKLKAATSSDKLILSRIWFIVLAV